MLAQSTDGDIPIRFIYDVADPRVWGAPETLRDCAFVLLGTLLAFALLKRSSRKEPEPDADPGDFLAQQDRVVFAYRGMRWSRCFLGYAALLTVICCLGLCFVGRLELARVTTFTVPVTAGWPAAFAGLLPPAALLVAVGLAVVIIGRRYREAVVGTGLLAVIWLWCLAPVLAAVGLAARASPAGGAIMLVGALAAGAGAWLRWGGLAGGRTLAARLRLREQQAQWEHAQYEAQHAPETGEYLASGGVGYWNSSRLPVREPVIKLARTIRWDRDGLTIEWSPGGMEHLSWNDLRSLRYSEDVADKGQYEYYRPAINGAQVETSSGRIRITSDGAGYAEFTAALEAHVWGRQQPERAPR